MIAVFAAIAIGAPFPDTQLISSEGIQSSLFRKQGKFVALIIAGQTNAQKTLDFAREAETIISKKRPVEHVVIVSGNQETIQNFHKDNRLKSPIYTADEQWLTHIGALENGNIKPKAFLINPRGRLVKTWDNPNPQQIPKDIVSWLDGAGVSDQEPAIDPRDILQIEKRENEKGLLVLFLAVRGAIDGLYWERIAEIANKANTAGISVIGIFSAYDETTEQITTFAQAAKLDFPCAADPGAIIADLYRAEVTPTAYLLDPAMRLFYFGAIDSSSRQRPGMQNYLADAIKALIEGKPPRPKASLPFGAKIRRSPEDDR
jgi:peroxiredoxin